MPLEPSTAGVRSPRFVLPAGIPTIVTLDQLAESIDTLGEGPLLIQITRADFARVVRQSRTVRRVEPDAFSPGVVLAFRTTPRGAVAIPMLCPPPQPRPGVPELAGDCWPSVLIVNGQTYRFRRQCKVSAGPDDVVIPPERCQVELDRRVVVGCSRGACRGSCGVGFAQINTALLFGCICG